MPGNKGKRKYPGRSDLAEGDTGNKKVRTSVISDFIEEQSAQKQLVIGQGNVGYWTNDRFLDNVKDAMEIAALK